VCFLGGGNLILKYCVDELQNFLRRNRIINAYLEEKEEEENDDDDDEPQSSKH
jgi:hypothetical protein